MLNEVLTEGANDEQGIVRLPCEDVAVNKLKKKKIFPLCVYVCLCDREREREREGEKDGERERERERGGTEMER